MGGHGMFERGRDYGRESLLAFAGSRQTQVGIIWGDAEPGCIICTSGGKKKKEKGYADERLSDGRWHYYGQGSQGDHDETRPANRLMIDGERSVLLFIAREPTAEEVRAQHGSQSKRYRYEGSFLVSAWDRVTPTAGIRAGDALLRFTLVPSEGVAPESPAVIETYSSQPSVADMRAILREYGGRPRQGEAQGREYYMRSALVRAYALLVANGVCGLCGMPAPFALVNGSPYLEVHHLHRLADGGPDLPENVAALCPNCHRAVHHSVERATLTETLVAFVRARELAWEQSVTKPS